MAFETNFSLQSFHRLRVQLSALWGRFNDALFAVLAAAPGSPSQGMLVYADGSTWDPHSGAGLYYYNGSAWVFTGSGGSGGGAVTSVFTRTGAVVGAASDYDASQIDNDSGVAGTFVDDALDNLDTDITAAEGRLDDLEAGPLRPAAGSAAAPAHSFSGDTDAGMYSISNSQIGWAVGGTERLRITAGGALRLAGSQLQIPPGTAAIPSFILNQDFDTGMYQPAVNELGWTTQGVSRMTLDTTELNLGSTNLNLPTGDIDQAAGLANLDGITTKSGSTFNALLTTEAGLDVNTLALTFDTGFSVASDPAWEMGAGGPGMYLSGSNLAVSDGSSRIGYFTSTNWHVNEGITFDDASGGEIRGNTSFPFEMIFEPGGIETFRAYGGRAVYAIDGTAALPVWSFDSDPDTGLHRPSANTMGMSAGGSTRATVTTSGFDVTGELTATGDIKAQTNAIVSWEAAWAQNSASITITNTAAALSSLTADAQSTASWNDVNDEFTLPVGGKYVVEVVCSFSQSSGDVRGFVTCAIQNNLDSAGYANVSRAHGYTRTTTANETDSQVVAMGRVDATGASTDCKVRAVLQTSKSGLEVISEAAETTVRITRVR